MLQTIEVFKAFYTTYYDEYIGNALDYPNLQTKAGNPKVPGYLMVSTWIVECRNPITP
jgi:hypothetical protein